MKESPVFFPDEVLSPAFQYSDTVPRLREDKTLAASVTKILSNDAFKKSLIARGDLSPLYYNTYPDQVGSELNFVLI